MARVLTVAKASLEMSDDSGDDDGVGDDDDDDGGNGNSEDDDDAELEAAVQLEGYVLLL